MKTEAKKIERDDIIRMAREAGFSVGVTDPVIYAAHERFFNAAYAAGAAAEREKVAAWMIQRSYATGHGDTTEDLLKELEWQVRESEREASAKVCEAIASSGENTDNWTITRDKAFHDCAAAIREALAQPEQIPPSVNSNTHQPEQEHVIDCPRCGHCCPQTEQEPVAWYDPEVMNEDRGISWTPGQFHTAPLYTSPQQRKPLTDEEVVDLKMIGRDLEFVSMTALRRFARAIEAAHGIKENT